MSGTNGSRPTIKLPSVETIETLLYVERALRKSGVSQSLVSYDLSPTRTADLIVPSYWGLTQFELSEVNRIMEDALSSDPRYDIARREIINRYNARFKEGLAIQT